MRSRHYDAGMPVTAVPTRERPPTNGRALAWGEALSGACVAFVSLVAVGAVLVAAAKLQFTSLGTGTNPLRVLTAAVLSGIATLGTGVRLGGLTVSAVPLGALLLSGGLIAWAAAGARPTAHPPRTKGDGLALSTALRFGLILGLLCAAAALLFRIPEGPVPVSVPPLRAGFLGLVWGIGFGFVGVRLRGSSVRSRMSSAWSRLFEGSAGGGREVLICSGAGLMALAATSIAAVLGALIFRLWTSPLPGGFGVGDAVADLVFLLAFLPNVLVAAVTLSLGASVTVGAEITAAGERVGPVIHYSLASWGDGPTPLPAFLLLLVPALSFLFGGYAARVVSERREGTPLRLVPSAALTALVVGALTLVGNARLGGGLVSGSGVASVAPETMTVIPLAFAWALAFGFAGWSIHDFMERRRMHGSGDL
jgi:hypothetical protein